MVWVRNDPSGPYFEEELFLSLDGMVFVHRLLVLLAKRNFRLLSSRHRGALQVFRLNYPEVSRFVDIYMDGDPSAGWSIVAAFQDLSASPGAMQPRVEVRFFRTSGPDQRTTPESALRTIEMVFKEV